MGISQKLETLIGVGLATTFVLTLATGVSYLLNAYLLGAELHYLRTLSFMGVIAGIVYFTDWLTDKTHPAFSQGPGIYLPLIAVNCAVLGISLFNVQAQYGFVASLFLGVGAGIAFTLVLMLFAGLQERLDTSDVPAPFKGTSIALVTAGFMSLAFMGFAGLLK